MRQPGRRKSPSPALPKLYVSTATEGDIGPLLGSPHYSYHFAATLFRRLLEAHGVAARHLPMPQSYPTAAALNDGDGARVHLIFRSTEQIRLLKPAVNIACFPWEFPVLKTETLAGEHPFANQVRMLGLCDEVWTPSAYAKGVLEAHGVANVQCIPAPVADAARMDRAEALRLLAPVACARLDVNQLWSPSHAKARAEAGIVTLGEALREAGAARIFLTVCNPEDFRKNLDAMVRGFHGFRRTHPGAVLIVKALTAERRYPLAEVASNVVPAKLAAGTVLADAGILILNEYLSDEGMRALYSAADFYVCTSIGEGQNLPLLEAMAHGTVAVSPATTAMADYVDAANAHVIATKRIINGDPHLAGTVSGRPFEVDVCNAAAVQAALERAMGEEMPARARRAAAGVASVRAVFGAPVVWRKVAARLEQYAQVGA